MLLKNGKTLTIRKAKKEDAQEILDYIKKVGGESNNLLTGAEGLPYTVEQEEAIIERINASASSVMLVGVVDSRIISVANLSASDRERIAHQGTVGISVLNEFWGLGVGTCMMNALINFAKASGTIEILHLGVKSDNLGGIALYKKCGFQQIGVYPKFFKFGDVYYDEILMNLYL